MFFCVKVVRVRGVKDICENNSPSVSFIFIRCTNFQVDTKSRQISLLYQNSRSEFKGLRVLNENAIITPFILQLSNEELSNGKFSDNQKDNKL